jgi:hypothetical protein
LQSSLRNRLQRQITLQRWSRKLKKIGIRKDRRKIRRKRMRMDKILRRGKR